MEGAADDASRGLQRPAGLEDMLSDKGWESLSEERRRKVIEIWNHEVEYTEESRRIHEEFVVGNGTANFTPHPFLLPNDFNGSIESLGRPWRIFTDSDAACKLLDMANEYHWEMECEQRESMLQERYLTDAAKRKHAIAFIADGNEGKVKRQRIWPETDMSGIEMRTGHSPLLKNNSLMLKMLDICKEIMALQDA